MAYEKKFVLFNIGALGNSVADAQSTDSDDGFKLATKILQQSAGIFSHLKGVTAFAIPQEQTPDLNAETLEVLSIIMMAQAQEIFVKKSIQDGMNNQIIAKSAFQCEKLYADALQGLQSVSQPPLRDKHWIATVRINFI